MSALHQRIKLVRTNAGLTQTQVGDACDPPVSKAAVSFWERNKTTPSEKQLRTLAALAGAPAELLIEEKSETFDTWIVETRDTAPPTENDLLAMIDIFRRLPCAARQRVIRAAERELIASKQ